jgi:CRISPR-associated protein Csh2
METIKNRHEIVFIYDVKDGNPNGDPMDSNKPRMDPSTGINIVSDVRLKRTIRDYFIKNGEEIFVNGEALTSEKRALELVPNLTQVKKYDRETGAKALLEKCIDLRLFGGTVPIKTINMSLTGPCQFRFGRSLHIVDPVFQQGTAAFTSGEKSQQRSFREEWTLNYSCIAFYGVINQNSAAETLLTDEDVNKLFEAMWEGTKDLITRSKMEQLPRLLIDVVYNDNENFHIGELDKAIKLVSNLPGEKIREVSDFVLEVSELLKLLESHNDRIKEIRYRIDPRLKLTLNGEPFNIVNLISGKMKPLSE